MYTKTIAVFVIRKEVSLKFVTVLSKPKKHVVILYELPMLFPTKT